MKGETSAAMSGCWGWRTTEQFRALLKPGLKIANRETVAKFGRCTGKELEGAAFIDKIEEGEGDV